MAILKAYYESEDKVPAEVKQFYAEADGKWLLQVGAVEGFMLEDVVGLKNAVGATRKERDDALAKLKVFDGLDAAKARASMKTLEDLGDLEDLKNPEKAEERIKLKEAQLAAQFEADRVKLVKKHTEDLATVSGVRDARTAQLRTTMIRSAASQAIANAKGSSHLLLPVVESRVRMVEDPTNAGQMMVEVIGSDGNAMLTRKTGSTDSMTIDEFVGTLKEDDKYAAVFEGSGASGSGASGGGGGTGSGGKSGGGTYKLTETQARDVPTYRAAREAADKAGQTIEVVPD